MMIRTKQHPRGSVLVFTLLILAVLLSTALSAAGIVVLGKNSSRATEKSALAFQIADGAAENVLKRIYKDQDTTLNDLASGLYYDPEHTQTRPRCSNGVISGGLPSASSGLYSVSFLDNTGTPLQCSGTGYATYNEWRTKLSKIVSSGAYGSATRAIDIAIEPPACGGGTVDDADGNTYDTVQIGTQCWTKANLRVGTLINGNVAQTNNSTIEKYCYDDDPMECTAMSPAYGNGGIYTWDEAMQYNSSNPQGICPTGWHIPTDSEWYTLENYVDPTINDPNATGLRGVIGGTQLKYNGTSGFTAQISGYKSGSNYIDRNVRTIFWTSSENGTNGWQHYIDNLATGVGRGQDPKTQGFSVRCIQD